MLKQTSSHVKGVRKRGTQNEERLVSIAELADAPCSVPSVKMFNNVQYFKHRLECKL